MVKNHISPQGNVIFGGNFERVFCQAGLWLLSYGGGGTFGGTADAPQLLSRVEVLFFFLHVCVCSNAHTIIFYASVTVREFWIFPPDSVVNTHRHTHRICHMCADVSSFPLTVAISVLPYHSLSFLLFFFFSPVFLYLCFFYSFPSSTFYFHLSLCESSPCHSSIPHQQRAERAGHPCWDTLWSEQPVTPREVCLLDNYTRTANVTVTEEVLSLRLCFVFLQL